MMREVVLQEVCLMCGWHGDFQPTDTMFCGPGGGLTCPECLKAKRNPGIESWGYVRVLRIQPDGYKFINCGRCGAFYRVGELCKSKFCKTIPGASRRYDIDSIPLWLRTV